MSIFKYTWGDTAGRNSIGAAIVTKLHPRKRILLSILKYKALKSYVGVICAMSNVLINKLKLRLGENSHAFTVINLSQGKACF